ncbi:MAG: head GIN domain-containing protein [Dehalococcoidales bacterium]
MYKKTIIVLSIVMLVLGLFAGSCYGAIRGSSKIVNRTFDFENFTRVEASSAFTVEISRGSTYSVSVTADDNLFEFIRVNELDGVLKIDMLPGYSYFPSALVARIVMPDIYSVTAYAATEIEISAFDLQHNFHASASGASTIDFIGLRAFDIVLDAGTASRIEGVVMVEDMEIDVSGASRIKLSGQAKDIKMGVSAASNVDLAGVATENAAIGLSGASSAVVNLTGRLDAGLTGASHLKYLGDPDIGNINLSDFSSVGKE